MAADVKEQRSWAQHVAQTMYRSLKTVLSIIHVNTWCFTLYMVRLFKILLAAPTPTPAFHAQPPSFFDIIATFLII